jgi:hypothetical protein
LKGDLELLFIRPATWAAPLRRRCPREEDELVTTEARDRVRGSNARVETPTYLLEESLPRIVARRVVDVFEVVQAEE